MHDLIPDAFSVCGESVCRDAAVVLREEDGQVCLVEEAALLGVVVSFPEAEGKLVDCLLELLWLQDLVRQSDESEVEVVLDARVLKAGRFRDCRP